MHAKFKIVKVDNEIIIVNYDGGSGLLDGIIEYNVITGNYKIIKYSLEHDNSDAFVKLLINVPKFVYFAKISYETQKPDNHNRVINCG